jgi:coenzyme F420-reducing hydrogenase alpha subunit
MTSEPRKIRVEALTRVEGEGGLFVRVRGDQVEEVRLEIFEPPRLFEALLRIGKLRTSRRASAASARSRIR